MSTERITQRLVDAYQLLDMSERILEDAEDIPLRELPRVLLFIRKNLRDAMNAINDAEKEFDAMIREIDEEEEKAVLGGGEE